MVFDRSSLGDGTLLQPDGKLILVGDLFATDLSVLPSILRLTTNGAIDASFTYGPVPNVRRALLALQPDGKILLGQELGSNRPPPMVRLHSNGAMDTSLQPALGTNTAIQSATVQPDGRILITGILFSMNETYLSSVARLEPDGALDPTFFFPSETSGTVFTAQILSSGDVVIGGQFGFAGGIQRPGLAKLVSSGKPRLFAANTSGTITLEGNTGRTYCIDVSDNLTNWTTLTTILNTNGTVPFEDPEMAIHTNRFYRAVLVWP
jgi:uncharacterized delta-60 repeat protein